MVDQKDKGTCKKGEMAELKKAKLPITILKAQEFKYNRDKYNHWL